MRRFQAYIIITIVWLSIFYNIERFSEPINIASFVYAFILVSAVLVLSVPSLYKRAFAGLFMIALIPYGILKLTLGYEVIGRHLPITITEVCAIGITIGLCLRMGRELAELQEEISCFTINHLDANVPGFEDGQAEIYREIRRARRYQRHASLLAVSPSEKSIKLSLHRFTEEAKSCITRRYITAQIIKLLSEELKDTDVIVQRNSHLVILLPETNKESLLPVIERIRESVQQKLGISLYIGYSTFPEEAVTFTALLEIAEKEMNTASVQDELSGKPAEIQTIEPVRVGEISVK